MKNQLILTITTLTAGIATVVALHQRYRIKDLEASVQTKDKIINDVLTPSLKDAYSSMSIPQLVEQIRLNNERFKFNSIISNF